MKKELIKWSNLYSVGYQEIDGQHQNLVGIINELYAAFTEAKADAVIKDILEKMIDYTGYHFGTEEKYFDKYKYPQSPEHIVEHQNFVQKVSLFFSEYKNGSVTLSYDVMNFLKEWLLNHIKISDKTFGQYYSDKGIVEL